VSGVRPSLLTPTSRPRYRLLVQERGRCSQIPWPGPAGASLHWPTYSAQGHSFGGNCGWLYDNVVFPTTAGAKAMRIQPHTQQIGRRVPEDDALYARANTDEADRSWARVCRRQLLSFLALSLR
jgi:hypothetical protein